MSHFSDIGFSIFEDEGSYETHYFDLMNEILQGKDGPVKVKRVGERLYFHVCSLGKIRYIFIVDEEHDDVIDFEMGHDNEHLTSGMGAVFMAEEATTAFYTMQVEKDGIPFYFACLNAPVSDLRGLGEDDEVQFSVASFAEDDIELLDEGELSRSKKRGMAAESYISYFNHDPCYGFVSGIVKGFSIEQNPATQESYYAIDADCLGVHFKMLVDPKLLEGKVLEIGKVICGSFWNTAFLGGKK